MNNYQRAGEAHLKRQLELPEEDIKEHVYPDMLMNARCDNIACTKPSQQWKCRVTLDSLRPNGVVNFCSPQCASKSVEWEQMHYSEKHLNSGRFLRGVEAGRR